MAVGLAVAIIAVRSVAKTDKKESSYGMEGMCLGTAIGSALGNNTGIGISLGMLIGLAIGSCMPKKADDTNR